MTEHKTVKLSKILQQEINWLDELITVLSEEKKALIERQFEMLENLANQKEVLSSSLEQSARERVELLEITLDNNDSKSALKTLLSTCPAEEAKQITELNNQLAEKILKCRELNTVNGQVITTNLNTRQEIFNSISGQNSSEAINVYTASGNVKSSVESSRHQEA